MSRSVTPSAELRREPDVLLHGEYQGSASSEPVYLVTRGDATMQLTAALFALLDELDDVEVRADGSVVLVDAPRSSEDLAVILSRRLDCDVQPEDVDFLIEERLRPLNLVRWAGDEAPAPPTAVPDPLLALRFRFAMLEAPAVQWLSRGLSLLFHPIVALPMVVAYLAAVVATLDHGLTGAFRQVLLEPWHVVLLYVVLTLSGLWHELGHAAACHRGGGRPGRIGAGLYLVWPAFFTDVTDSYRLSRGGRLRTDLGGIYFNVVLGVGLYATFLATGYEPLLLLVLMQIAEILYQFVPILRLDGYWIVSDLTGVPDLFPLMKPAVKSLRPGAEPDPSIARLRRSARWAITAWSLITIPLLALNLVLLVVVGPSIARESLDVAGEHLDVFGDPGVGVANLIVAGFGLLMALLPLAGLVLTVVLFGFVGFRHLSRRFGWAARFDVPSALAAARGRVVLAVVLLAVAALITVLASGGENSYLVETRPPGAAVGGEPTVGEAPAGSTASAPTADASAGPVPGPPLPGTSASETVTTTVDVQGSAPTTVIAEAQASVGSPATGADPAPSTATAAAPAEAPATPSGTAATTAMQPAADDPPAAQAPATTDAAAQPPTSESKPPPPPVAAAPAQPATGSLEAHASAGGSGPSEDSETVRDTAGNTASATARSTGGTNSSAEASASAVISGSSSDSAARAQAEEVLDRLPVPGR